MNLAFLTKILWIPAVICQACALASAYGLGKGEDKQLAVEALIFFQVLACILIKAA